MSSHYIGKVFTSAPLSINQCLFSIQTNNDNIHTFVKMNNERAGKEVLFLY